MSRTGLLSDERDRRDFLIRAAGGLLGLRFSVAFLADSEAAEVAPAGGGTAKNVIYLYMDGGMSHVDTWDPKPGDVAGPTRTIPTDVTGVALGEYLPRTATVMRHGSLVRSLTSTQGAHEQGNYYMHTSYELRGTIGHPCLGAWLSHFRGPGNTTLPASVYVGNASRHPGAGFFPPEHAPLFVSDPDRGVADLERQEGLSARQQEARMRLAARLDEGFMRSFGGHRSVAAHAEAYDGAFRMMASRDVAAFDLTREKPETRDAYGRDPFGQGCLLARRLVESGVRFVEVSLHGWDTHSGNFVTTPDLCRKLDAGLASLVTDLHDRGLLDETLVVVTTEFGRSPQINGALGRDHYPKAFSAALFGGGVRQGHVHGSTDERGEEVVDGLLTIPDFNATLAFALGLPVEQKVISSAGRPFTLADKGKPDTSLFGGGS